MNSVVLSYCPHRNNDVSFDLVLYFFLYISLIIVGNWYLSGQSFFCFFVVSLDKLSLSFSTGKGAVVFTQTLKRVEEVPLFSRQELWIMNYSIPTQYFRQKALTDIGFFSGPFNQLVWLVILKYCAAFDVCSFSMIYLRFSHLITKLAFETLVNIILRVIIWFLSEILSRPTFCSSVWDSQRRQLCDLLPLVLVRHPTLL
jgi:hypothetical protein